MKLDKALFNNVSAEAVKSPRLRMARDMRTTPQDQSPGTELPIHPHRTSTETCIVLRGAAEEIFYDDNGNETERVVMRTGTDCCGVNIEVGRWHKIVSLQPGTVIFEAKDGAYEPTSPEDILNA